MKRTTRSSWVASRLREQGVAPLRPVLTSRLFAELWPHSLRESTVLIPEVVFWLMTCGVFGDGTLAGCIPVFWSTLQPILPWLDAEPITAAAFSKARKLKPKRGGTRDSLSTDDPC